MSPAPRWLRVLRHSRWVRTLTRWLGGAPPIPSGLWRRVLQAQPFLQHLEPAQRERLQLLCRHFLAQKTFSGANGLQINDEMALQIATQACLPWIHWGLAGLDWYRGFAGIVVHPDEVWAQREETDAAGVVHRWREALAGEAMHGGPLMLAWSHVRAANDKVQHGHNLVIHEFAHQIDMRHKSRHQAADGCPQLPRGFLGLEPRAAAQHWQQVWSQQYRHFVRQVQMAERFGAHLPWLDAYGATDAAEFFAVACEAYTVQRARFGAEFPALLPLLDAFFRHPAAAGLAPPARACA
ncbi:uncharacterized protein conserved in bacteria [Serpentinimonas raichei]|uniref:Uncharacterized protein conserved in bacteria n=1 Tax=Serpentinimonas raichei TaxID=1458425 RepID=A0A060NQB7_9BURK|nr:M90 family metallopeptidase [Serpentinimonas raichei]BAO81109.1 uncharacterized protein conserved in bacteria [Serpentinimonas raichei]